MQRWNRKKNSILASGLQHTANEITPGTWFALWVQSSIVVNLTEKKANKQGDFNLDFNKIWALGIWMNES